MVWGLVGGPAGRQAVLGSCAPGVTKQWKDEEFQQPGCRRWGAQWAVQGRSPWAAAAAWCGTPPTARSTASC